MELLWRLSLGFGWIMEFLWRLKEVTCKHRGRRRMKETTREIKKIRLAIILTSIVGLLSSFSITVTTFAYGIGDNTIPILLLYPTFILSTILVIANIRLGYFLILLTTLAYSIMLTSEVGYFLVFNFQNSVLLTVLLLPYLAFLTLIPLTVTYLTKNLGQKKTFQIGAIILSIGFIIFAIVDRQNKDYYGNIFIDADLLENGEIVLNCKPGFADSRTFVIKTKSKELEEQIKEFGEYYQGSYFLQNTRISKNFRFTELKSITIKQFGDHKLKKQLTWTTNELNGETEFLRP